MSEPVTATLIALSAATAAVGSISQANAQSKMANFNAKVAEQNAAAARQQAEADAQKQRRNVARQLAKRRTGFAAAGVSLEGSPLDLLEDLSMEGELDVLGIRQRGLAQAREFTLGASRSRFQGQLAQQRGAFSAADSLLSGGARVSRTLTPLRLLESRTLPIDSRGSGAEG